MSRRKARQFRRGVKRGFSAMLVALIVAALFGLSVMKPAVAIGSLTPGSTDPVTLSFTVPTVPTTFLGVNVGTNSGEYQVLNMHLQLVLKTASIPPANGWTWDASESTKFINSAITPTYCTSPYTCSRSGLYNLSVTRAGNPITYTPSYYAATTSAPYEILLNLSTNAAPAVGTVGLQTGDLLSLTFRDGLVQIPADIADYEFRVAYEMVQIGTGNHGPFTNNYSVQTSAGTSTLSTPAAPTAVAGASSARVTPAVVSPAPAKYVITASPQVGGVTKTCTVTPPVTYCNVTGLTPGTSYTFTTQVFPLDDIPTGSSAASNAVIPFAAPTVSSISPSVGPIEGGQLVTITGTNFLSGATVRLGGATCTPVTVISDSQLTCTTSAAAASTQHVTVTNPNGSLGLKLNAYQYVAYPTISSVTDSFGPTTGGTSIVITGTRFVTAGLTVAVGGQPCLITASSSTSITCTTAAGTVGAADVVVTNFDLGTVTSQSAFTYKDDSQATQAETTSSLLVLTGSNFLVPAVAALSLIFAGLALMTMRGRRR